MHVHCAERAQKGKSFSIKRNILAGEEHSRLGSDLDGDISYFSGLFSSGALALSFLSQIVDFHEVSAYVSLHNSALSASTISSKRGFPGGPSGKRTCLPTQET